MGNTGKSKTASLTKPCKYCGKEVLFVQMKPENSWLPVEVKPTRQVITEPHPSGDGRIIGKLVVVHRAHKATCDRRNGYENG